MTKQPVSFSFPVHSFRHLETPFQKRGVRNYLAVIGVGDLPDLSDWRKLNVRDPKLTGSVPRKIREGLSNPDMFLFMNRGLVIAVDSVSFDNKTSKLRVTMKDPKIHGLLDGGHSYKIIMDERDELGFDQYVRVEFLEGFDHEEISAVVDARNTSNQVKDESLLNLEGAFDQLKEALKHESYYNDIAFQEYEVYKTSGEAKPIDVREVIAVLTAFDRDHFDDSAHPIISYSSKAQCLKHFKNNKQSYEKIYPIAPELLRLFDSIQEKLPTLYNDARGQSGEVSGGKFGKLTGVMNRETKLYYLDKTVKPLVPDGFIYPMLASFRALLMANGNGSYRWATKNNPVELLDTKLGLDLARSVGQYALQQQNPTKTGKFAPVWQSCYDAVLIHHLRSKNH